MSKAQTLKSVVKANLSEDAALKQYLTSRGINPKYVTKNQMVAHSKMGQFLKWKRDHNVAEEVKDEYARKVDKYLKKKHNKEEVELDEVSTDGYHKAAVKSRQDAAVKVMSSMGQDKQAKTKLNARNAGLKRLGVRTSSEMKKANSGPQKPIPSTHDGNDRGYGQGRYMGDSVEHDDEVVVEMDNRTPSSDRQEQRNNSPEVLAKKDKEQQERLRGISPERRKILRLPEPKESVTEAQSAAVRFQRALENAKKKREEETARNAENAKRALTPKNENYQDPKAASSMPNDGANNPDDVAPKDKNKKLIQMSKSARIIKSIYKKKGVKEEAYGKKPKMQNVSADLEEPKAAAVLTGGTTLTGEKRDTIEIDPMMKMRKPISGKR